MTVRSSETSKVERSWVKLNGQLYRSFWPGRFEWPLNWLKVSHEISENFESSWFLEKVKIKNVDDNEEELFLIRQWLDKNSEKGI